MTLKTDHIRDALRNRRMSESVHPDDVAIDVFVLAMKEKMAINRARGRSGWQDCELQYLWDMLREHVEKDDLRDVAIIAMMIWHNSMRHVE